jgi:CxxC motif-containing protein (DUF1111 family)
LTERINEQSYFLHNGRAQLGGNSVMAGAEALPARQRSVGLSTRERQAVIRFLESLSQSTYKT